MAVDTYALTSLANLKSYLGITSSSDDTILEKSIDRASDIAERYMGRKILSRAYVEWRDTYGQERIRLYQYPASIIRFVGIGYNAAITVGATNPLDPAVSVTVSDSAVILYRQVAAGTDTTTTLTFATYPTTALMATAINATTGFSGSVVLDLPSRYIRRMSGRTLRNATVNLEAPDQAMEDYLADLDSGVVYGRQLTGYRSVLIDYTAGYATTPDDIEQAVLMIAASLFQGRKRDPNIASESLGGYSYSLRAPGQSQEEARSLLDAFKTLR
jgi:hypothetical protein